MTQRTRDTNLQLQRLDRRDSHLILVSLFVTLALALGLALTFVPNLIDAPRVSNLGQLFFFLLIVVAYITIKHRENRKLRQQTIDERVQVEALQSRVKEISAILKVTGKVSSVGSLETTLRLILVQAVRLSGSDRGYLLLKGPTNRTLRLSSDDLDVESEAEACRSARWLSDAPKALHLVRNAVLKKGGCLLLHQDQPLRDKLGRLSDTTAEDLDSCPASVLASPLRAFGKTFGVVAVTIEERANRRFNDNDLNLLRILADNASCAMRNLTLYEKVRSKNEKLRQSMEFQKKAQKRLLEAEKLSAMREMVSGVAHELNNPLTSILGYVQLLDRTSLDDTCSKYVKIIFGETERCRAIVQDFLAFARKEKSDRIILHINDLVRQILSLRRCTLLEAGIEIELDLDHELPRMVGDPHHLQQALLNTLKTLESIAEPDPNNGERSITIATRQIGETTTVRFTASGEGAPDENLENLFDPFFIASSDGNNGSGLSLCVAREIVSDHGGTIEIEANGSGVVCEIRLCLESAETRPPSQTEPTGFSAPTLAELPEPPVADERLHALVVVDPQTRSQIEEVLSQESIDAELIENPQDPRERIQIRSYDLVVLDADGIPNELRQELTPLAAWCPHVILHNPSEPPGTGSFPSDDHHFHLPKPLEKGDFRQVVRRAIHETSLA